MASISDAGLIQQVVQVTLVQNYVSYATLTLLVYDIGELTRSKKTPFRF